MRQPLPLDTISIKSIRSRLPGLAVASAIVIVAWAITSVVSLSILVVSLVVSAVTFNIRAPMAALQPGLMAAGKTVLRAGIVLLGLRISIQDVTAIGWRGLLLVVVVVIVPLVGIRWLAGRMGISRSLGLLLACGYAICGQSAIAAVAPLSDAKEEEIGYATGLVAMFGGLAVLTLPLLNGTLLSLDPGVFGTWAGATVHDVAQVVATAATAGPEALVSATVVKLTRVILLAPLLIGLSVRRHKNIDQHRTHLVPPFIVGFIVAVLIRSSGLVPNGLLEVASTAEKLFLATAMVGLGSAMRVRTIASLGGRPLILAALAWATVTVLALGLTKLLI